MLGQIFSKEIRTVSKISTKIGQLTLRTGTTKPVVNATSTSQMSSHNITTFILKTSPLTVPRPQNTPRTGKARQLTGISTSKSSQSRFPNNEGTTTLLDSSQNPSTQGLTITTKVTSPITITTTKTRSTTGQNKS